MKKLVEINSNNLAELLDGFVDTGVKVIDEMDLFKEDELFASVPYGKIGHALKMDIQLEKQMINQQANHCIMHQDRF